MDRIDAMKVFVSAVDEGSLAGAGRRLGRSPAAVSRAIAFLEAHVGAELLHRTTRALKLSETGERYVAACRRVLIDLEEADIAAGGERAAVCLWRHEQHSGSHESRRVRLSDQTY